MDSPKTNTPLAMEDNLKKAVTEMLVLHLLSLEDMHAPQIIQNLEEYSGKTLSIVFPYAALYRMINAGHIWEAYKKVAPDGRRRQYYQITDAGRAHLAQLVALYRHFIGGVDRVLETKTA